ncbi:MAG: hypothetical protein WCY53_04480 [Sphaerochaetaceae bacterium]
MAGGATIKKTILLTVVMFSLAAFSLFSSSLLSFGPHYSYVTENALIDGEKGETTLHTSGVYLSFYKFSDYYDLGFFLHSSLSTLWEARVATKDDIKHLYFNGNINNGYFSLSGGMAITERLSYDSYFYFGIGPSTHLFFFEAEDKPFLNFMFGVGFSMGYNYFITPSFYIDTGTIMDYNFLSYYKNPSTAKWIKEDNYGMYTIRYYLGFGFY